MSKKTILVIIIAIVVITIVALGVKILKPSAINAPSDTQTASLNKETGSKQGEVAAVTGAETDALTGSVTAISKESITVKNDEREVKVNLYENTDTYSIDPQKGLVIKNISEVKSGMKVTVDYNVGSKTARYVVIEK